MLNVVYLVLVFYGANGTTAGASVAIPQSSMKQCEVNAKNYSKQKYHLTSYCIVGVMPK